MDRRVRRRTRTAIVGGVAVAVVAAAVAAALGFGGAEPAAPVASNLPPATAPVTKQTLAQTEKVTGTLGYGAAKDLPVKSSGGTVTWLPAEGATVRLGKPAYKVDGKPVVLIHGSVPPYRKLHIGVEGPDVKQLEQNLTKLGYTGFTVDDEYTSGTADAVAEWQEDLGLEQTGTVAVDQIVVASGDIRIGKLSTQVGAPAGKAVFSYTGTTRVVTIALDVAKQQLVAKGIAASVILPDGKTVAGTVTGVGTVATAPASGDGNPTIEVVVSMADQKALGTLDAAPVSVTLTSGKHENVLTVPVTALVALAEGGYGVQVVEGSKVHYVAVKTGMFAGGRVEISGPGIAEGVSVGVPSS